MDLKEESALQGDLATHWYYVSKRRALRRLVGPMETKTLLDVGAGSGVFAKAFLSAGVCERAICVDPNYTDQWLAENRTENIQFVRDVDAVQSELVIMIDVLEHVDDDVDLLKQYVDRAAPGTKFLISVPAFQFLWSSHDEFLEHRRRYTSADLLKTVRSSGLTAVKSRYFFGALFPIAAIGRIADRIFSSGKPAESSAMGSLPGFLNAAMIAIHDLERLLLFPINKVCGVSAFCVAVKPDD